MTDAPISDVCAAVLVNNHCLKALCLSSRATAGKHHPTTRKVADLQPMHHVQGASPGGSSLSISSTPATLSSCAPVLATTDAGSVARVMAASKRCEYSPPPTRAASADAYMVPLDALCSHAGEALGICHAASQLGVSFLPAHSSAALPVRPQACCALTLPASCSQES